MKERDCLGDIGVDGRIILKIILIKLDMKVQTGFIWFRIGANGELS
jgi:hypothetical protein